MRRFCGFQAKARDSGIGRFCSGLCGPLRGASPLPQRPHSARRQRDTCGSGLAREEANTDLEL
ncbi:hypothetical protein PSN_5337 [Pseudomonas sp. NGC7]